MKLFKRVPTSGIQYTQDAESYLVVGRFTQIWNTQEGCWFLVTVAPSDPFSLNRDGTTMGPMSWGELKAKIGQASELIGELREKNYSLSGELAQLRREVQSSSENDSQDGGGASQAELDALRKERKTVRKKLALLLERIEKIES